MKIKNVCVLGGSGFVGRHVVHLLGARGYRVRVPTRRRERAKSLLVLPTVDIVEANIFDPGDLDRQFEGMDAVVNLVGILHENRRGRADKPQARRGDFHEVHVELPRKVAHACAARRVPRLLHMSALNADPTARSAYLRSKGLGEAIMREAGAAAREDERGYLDGPKLVRGYGLAATIFRPSVVFGREDAFLNLFARLASSLPLLPLASPDARFQPVFVEDVARAIVDSLADEATFGQTYDLCGPKVYTLQELVEFVAATLGRRCRIVRLGPGASYLQAWALELMPGKKLMTRDNFYSMQADSVCACPFPALFGFSPANMEAVVPGYLAQALPRARYTGFRQRAGR